MTCVAVGRSEVRVELSDIAVVIMELAGVFTSYTDCRLITVIYSDIITSMSIHHHQLEARGLQKTTKLSHRGVQHSQSYMRHLGTSQKQLQLKFVT